MITYDIPDPFETFVANKYRNYVGAIYDFFAREWHMNADVAKKIYMHQQKRY